MLVIFRFLFLFAFCSGAGCPGSGSAAGSGARMNRDSVIAQFPALLPLAARWAAAEERRILEQGVPLMPSEIEDARAVGVRNPAAVRLLPVKAIPRPEEPPLRVACDATDFLTSETRGLTLGYGIFVREDCWRERPLIVHELVHVAQYERFGGIEPFLQQYLKECLTVGYPQAPLEQEAIAVAAKWLFPRS